MVDFVPSTNELKKLKFLSPGPKNSTFGPMKSVTSHTIRVQRFSLPEKGSIDDPKGRFFHYEYVPVNLFGYRANCQHQS